MDDDAPLRTRAVFSGPEENSDSEPDEIFQKPRARMPRRAAGRPAGGSSLADLPNANECLSDVLEKIRGREVNVALLGSHKYMLADCLGIKVSAGQFRLKLDNPKLSFVGGRMVFECGIDRVSFAAFKLRFKPNVENPLKLCEFSKKHSVGGSADDVRLKLEFDPIVADDRCHISALGAIDVTVRIGDLNLSGVQNDLDKAAKNMVEDALSVYLDYDLAVDLGFLIDHFLQAGCGLVPEGNAGGGSGRGGAGSGGNSGTEQRLADLEARVAALEERLANTASANSVTDSAAAAAPSPDPAEPVGTAGPRNTGLVNRASPRTAEPVGAYSKTANPELKGRLGRIVIAFPAGTKDLKARAELFKAGEQQNGLRTLYGDFAVEMPPGTYDLNIGGHIVPGVTVESRHDTRVHVGVLRLNATGQTRFEIFEAGQQQSLGTYYGQNDVGLPPGRYDLDVSGQRETVTITAGAITDY